MKNIVEALSSVQKRIKAPKSQVNKFGGYSYRSCEDILLGLKQVMPENAAVVVSDEVRIVGDRVYIVATATFSFGGESLSAVGWAREEDSKKGMSVSQLTGACSSYARKYALNGLFAIDDSKDADAGDSGHALDSASSLNPVRVSAIVGNVIAAVKTENYPSVKSILERCGDKREKSAVWKLLPQASKDWITERANKEA